MLTMVSVNSFAEGNPKKSDSTKVAESNETMSEDDQAPVPVILKGCGELGSGEVYVDHIFCPSCCSFNQPSWSSGTICRDKTCSDMSKFTPGGVCGTCVEIAIDPLWGVDPLVKKYIITVNSTGTVIHTNGYTTSSTPEGLLIYFE